MPFMISQELIPADTTLEAARIEAGIFGRMAAEKRLALACRMSDSLRGVVASGVRHRHPDHDEEQVRLAVIRLTLGEEFLRLSGLQGPGQAMTQEEFLARLAHLLNSAGIPFMVAGSQSSSYHGHPRATNDVDLVIDPTEEQLAAFLNLLGADYYVSPETARSALARRSMFNIVSLDDGWKADLIIRKDRPFSVEEFQRRQMGTLYGAPLPIASAEDVILSKLEWNALTPSDRQVKDALGVAVVRWADLDRAYLRKWAPALGVADQLEVILSKAAELQPPSQS
jgi:hypothetical protein